MDAVVKKSRICGGIVIPPSKSQAHRLMIASFLAGGNFDFGLTGDDVEATKDCLDTLKDFIDGKKKKAVLKVGESGSTLRFLLPVVCALGINAEFRGKGRLSKRPISELVEVLRAHGANIVGDGLPLKTLASQADNCLSCGGLQAGEYRISGAVSSQYITGLLLALPLLDGDSKIVIEGELVSKAYVDMTLDVLALFGIKIEKTQNGYSVKGGQKFKNVADDIEGDWSSACFPLALGLLTGEVKAAGLKEDSLQADRAFVEIVKRMGGNIAFEKGKVVAKKSALYGVDFDATGCPDVVPILSVLCALANGKSMIFGVDRLKAKESDRLEAIINLLGKFGVETKYSTNTLEIFGNGWTSGNKSALLSLGNGKIEIDSYVDHRIAMSGVVIGLATIGARVKGVECMAKSYPSFLNDIVKIGANVRLRR